MTAHGVAWRASLLASAAVVLASYIYGVAAVAAQSADRATVAGPPATSMPAVEQQALVRKYCAVCHSDAAMNGGLSLQHYDPSVPNPALAAMLLSKLENNAMGAAGLGIPDKPVRDAWVGATAVQARGAANWTVLREVRMGAMRAEAVIASIVREVPARTGVNGLPVYRLTMTCDAATGVGAAQLAWSPEPRTNVTIAVAADGGAPVPHAVTGTEKMGNGTAAVSGLAATGLDVPLARRSLTISGLFPGESVVFPFGELRDEVRRELAPCFRAAP